jgi:hypothetical protein
MIARAAHGATSHRPHTSSLSRVALERRERDAWHATESAAQSARSACSHRPRAAHRVPQSPAATAIVRSASSTTLAGEALDDALDDVAVTALGA